VYEGLKAVEIAVLEAYAALCGTCAYRCGVVGAMYANALVWWGLEA
jgi:hypothetical protein